ncbi:MAG TPA: hypothetical protein VMT16_04050 [Thermoanaerobaculia bacterium]|nr:hypothetical protein [Thermoanaerobaculia bacterium]
MKRTVGDPGSADAPSTGGGASRRRRRVLAYLVAPYLLLVALHITLAFALPLRAPVVVDELGYLGNARLLATGEGLVDPAGRSAYKLGYSLLLIPAFLLAEAPEAGFELTLVINSLVLPTAYLALFLFLKRIRPELPDRDAALAAMAVKLHPAAVLYGLSAMSANAFIPLYCWLSLALFAAVERSRWWHWTAVGAAAALLYGIHERALGILVLIAAGAVVYPLFRRSRGSLVSLAALPAGAVILAGFRSLSIGGTTYPSSRSSEILQRTLDNAGAVVAQVAGQGLYLVLSSFGLLALAIGSGLVAWLQRRRLLAGSGFFWCLWIASGLSVFAISTLFMTSAGKVNLTFLMYGRYNDGVILPLMAVALALLHAVSQTPGRWRSLAPTVGVALILVGGALAVLAATRADLIRQAPYYFNMLASFPVRALRLWWLDRLWWALAAGIPAFAVALAIRWRLAVQALLVAVTLVTLVTYDRFWKPFAGARALQHVLADVVRALPEPPSRLLYEQQGFANFHYYNYSYYLPDIELVRVDLERLEPAGDLLVSTRTDLQTTIPGARLVAMENVPRAYGSHLQYLWVLPGELQERLAGLGWLYPEDFPARVLCPQPRSQLAIVRQESYLPWRSGSTRLRITNLGPCPWPNAVGLRSVEGSVQVGAAWRRPWRPNDVVGTRRVDLPRGLQPGQSLEIPWRLVPPGGGGGPGRSGRWIVDIGMLQQGGRWFSAWGDELLRIEVSH